MLEYEVNKKNPMGAAVLEYMMPFAGYAYAGRWEKGLLPAALTGAGLVGMLIGFQCVADQFAFDPNPDPCSAADNRWMVMGGLVVVAGRVWGVIGAHHAARAHNRALIERLQLQLTPKSDGLQLQLIFRR